MMLFLDIFDDYIDFNTVSFQSTSTYQMLSESFKAHAEKSQYRIPSYLLTDRVNVSTTMNRNNFNVKKSSLVLANLRSILPTYHFTQCS
jgi:hypothetical protein